MKFNLTWIKYDENGRLPLNNKWIVCLRIEEDKVTSFCGYFQKDYTGKHDFVFVYNGERCVDGESIEIDYWIPMAVIVGGND